MIARSPHSTNPEPWKRALAEAVTDPAELIALLELDPTLIPGARRAAEAFGLRVPRGFLARMRRGDPADPLLRQILPISAEGEEHPGFGPDPLGELDVERGPGLLQKYAGRALVVATPACAVHCRYCFRRHFPYSAQRPPADPTRALAPLADDPTIREVILSGGDPLSLDDDKLAHCLAAADALEHVRRIRVHTRYPIVLPERVTDTLIDLLSRCRATPVIVVHANHAAEIDATTRRALVKLGCHGRVRMFNQTVLLRGVNDATDSLAQLSEALFEADVLPYYLHRLDPVRGAAHFDVPEAQARALFADLLSRLPGYLVPRLVEERPGHPSKTPLAPSRDGL